MSEDKNKICPVELAGSLDNSLRRFLQNPRRLLKPYINDDMTVLDLGCGPGFFSIEIAKMLGENGEVIAADLQEGMLNKVYTKIKGTNIEQRIKLHKCLSGGIGVTEKVDFILAFYMIHEVPDKNKLFEELKLILKPDGKMLIVEPMFHVTKKAFNIMVNNLNSIGFAVIDSPKLFFSRSVLLTNKD
ncbi:MAG: class I SAM-dependent methyltransferase [Candidatus Kapaibacterium sp.]